MGFEALDLFREIDSYCERVDASYWSEPVNFVTNIAFIFAAILLLRKHARTTAPREIESLSWLVFVVGVGSGLFHSFANFVTMLADVIPIGIFLFYYLWVYFRLVFEWSPVFSVLGLFGFGLLNLLFITGLPESWTNGSNGYLATLLVLLFIGFHMRQFDRGAGNRALVAGGVFTLSLTFRMIDIAVCESFPLGTHFMWHVLNGITLFLVVDALAKIVHRRSQ